MMIWHSVRGSVVRFCPVLLIVWIVVLTLVVLVPHMGFIDFYLIFSMRDVNVVDFMNLLVVNTLFGYDSRLKICHFLEGHLEILW